MRSQPRDPHLAALHQELRVTLGELNRLHHPVYPGDPKRIEELELMVADLRTAIQRHREQQAAVIASSDAAVHG